MANLGTKDKFGTQVKEYDKYRTTYPKEFYDYVFRISKIENAKDILDLGCGTGKSTEPLYRKGLNLVGCDHDKRMLEQAKENARHQDLPIKYVLGNSESLPFGEEVFDIVNVGNAFHWFANLESVQEIKRILRPNGLLFIHWKQIGKEDVELRRKIFRQFNPEYNGSGILITPETVIGLLENQGFYDMRTLTKKYKFKYNLESAVGRLKTGGNYFRLFSKQKVDFESIAKGVFEDYLSEKGRIEFLSTTQIVYAYKGESGGEELSQKFY